MNPNLLKENSINVRIYGKTTPSDDLVRSVKANGVLEAIVIKSDNVIVSGHRRWQAAVACGLDDVPVRVVSFDDELAEREALIEYNRQREKTFSQKMNEADELKAIESERQEQIRRQKISAARSGEVETVENFPSSESNAPAVIWQAILYYKGVEAPPPNTDSLVELFSVQYINAPDGRQGDRYHPWQKPLEIADRFISHSAQPGDTVIDPFACTGTSLISASRLGRLSSGCDISDENIEIARGSYLIY